MEFSAAFLRALRSRPLAALGALYWRVTGRKVRARNRLRIVVAQSPRAYQIWIDTIERRGEVIATAFSSMASWPSHPRFSIIIDLTSGWNASDCEALLATLDEQIYPHFELIAISAPGGLRFDARHHRAIRIVEAEIDGGASPFGRALQCAAGEWCIILRPGTILNPASLYWFADAIQRHPHAMLLYGDNDWIDRAGHRRRPWFKPEWNSELALAQDYISQAMAVASEAARMNMDRIAPENGQAGYALSLAIGQSMPDHVVHIPHVLAHLSRGSEADFQDERLSVVQSHLDRLDERGARALASSHGTVQVNWPMPQPAPLVSIIIPTRDKVKLLRACVSSLLAKTHYDSFEVIIVDNGSSESSALSYLSELEQHPKIRILRDDRPYNFSQLNNLAVSRAHGDYVCLLNNDTEVIDGHWLDAMMRQASRSQAGAIGARLLYADGSIQHAGVVVGMGDAAGHAHRFQAANDVGYFARTHAAHGVSAVTAACLLVSKQKYLQVGGLDEQSLAIAFNDVDFCLKLRGAGWQNLYVPQAVLYHHESKSRGRDVSRRHIDRYRRELDSFQKRWNAPGFQDPLHHLYLDRSMEQYRVRL